MKLNLRNWNMRSRRQSGLTDEQRRILLISGIVIGAAALLTYPAILLYRRLRHQGNHEDEHIPEAQGKNFAPNYRGNHKPHRRKAEANGHMQQTQA